MIGYPQHVGAWMEDRNRALYGFGVAADPDDPDDLLREVATSLTEHGMHSYEYEERYLQQHYPTRLCPECDEVVRMGVTIDTRRELRWRHCPDCSWLPEDEETDGESFQMYIERRRRRRSR